MGAAAGADEVTVGDAPTLTNDAGAAGSAGGAGAAEAAEAGDGEQPADGPGAKAAPKAPPTSIRTNRPVVSMVIKSKGPKGVEAAKAPSRGTPPPRAGDRGTPPPRAGKPLFMLGKQGGGAHQAPAASCNAFGRPCNSSWRRFMERWHRTIPWQYALLGTGGLSAPCRLHMPSLRLHTEYPQIRSALALTWIRCREEVGRATR